MKTISVLDVNDGEDIVVTDDIEKLVTKQSEGPIAAAQKHYDPVKDKSEILRDEAYNLKQLESGEQPIFNRCNVFSHRHITIELDQTAPSGARLTLTSVEWHPIGYTFLFYVRSVSNILGAYNEHSDVAAKGLMKQIYDKADQEMTLAQYKNIERNVITDQYNGLSDNLDGVKAAIMSFDSVIPCKKNALIIINHYAMK